jgi:hypothetical protein
MAAIDKIYGTEEQYAEFKKWLKKHKPSAIKYLYMEGGWMPNEERPISNFPQRIDMWLIENCPIEWVQKRLREQYKIKS